MWYKRGTDRVVMAMCHVVVGLRVFQYSWAVGCRKPKRRPCKDLLYKRFAILEAQNRRGCTEWYWYAENKTAGAAANQQWAMCTDLV